MKDLIYPILVKIIAEVSVPVVFTVPVPPPPLTTI